MYLRIPERGQHPERSSAHEILLRRPCAHYQPTWQFVQVGKSIAILRLHPSCCLSLPLRPSVDLSMRHSARTRAYMLSKLTLAVNTDEGWLASAHGGCTLPPQLSRGAGEDSMHFVLE